MTHFLGRRSGLQTTPTRLALLCALVGGCGQTAGKPHLAQDDVGGGSSGGSAAVAGGGAAGQGGEAPTACSGEEVAVPKRLVRLSFGQARNAIAQLIDEAKAAELTTTYELADAAGREYLPLASPREGAAIFDRNWQTSDEIAADVAAYVVEHLAEVSGCEATPSEACVRGFLPAFAERAYRRPLTSDDEESLLQVVSEVIAAGDTPTEALRAGVHAVLESPQFLYRTEFGDEPKEAGPLTAYEVASQLSFFLTDGPPDQNLLDAAQADALSTQTEIAEHVARLLQMPTTQQNFEAALFSYFGLSGLVSVIVDEPAFTAPVRNSMYRGAQLLLANTLWSGPFSALLTSRRASVNASLAPFYGLESFPPAGAALDADGFAVVDLPDTRAGLLTQPGFLTSRARPDSVSVVARGLVVSALVLCVQNPPFPESLGEAVQKPPNLAGATEREKAEYRASVGLCNSCHSIFDPYGLALGNFDLLGRFVTSDEQGRPLDPSVTLPAIAGGRTIHSAVEMADELGASSAFRSCMTSRLLSLALAEGPSSPPDGCAARAVADELDAANWTLSDVVTGIATSNTLRLRAADAGAP